MRLHDAIGGYFELETQVKSFYHQELLSLNSGRNAFEYILLARKYKKIFIPYFTCDVLLEPLEKHGIEYEFYSIDLNLELIRIPDLKIDEALLYTNYYGLKTKYIENLQGKIKNLILDYAQSFFEKPLKGIDTFYSPRKFFGLPDGAYLSTEASLELPLERDISAYRCLHLLQRLDIGAEAGYHEFQVNDASLIRQPIRMISRLTERLLGTIDYELAKETRNVNFNFLHQSLKVINEFKFFDSAIINGPMVYPFFFSNEGLRKFLIERKIFVATYWPNVISWARKDSLEYMLAKNVIYLPIDQRYNTLDCERILNSIFMFIENRN